MRNYSVPFTNGDAGEPGCWIDGWWGQYGPDRVIQIAAEQGWEPANDMDRLVAEYAYARLECIGTGSGAEDLALEALRVARGELPEGRIDDDWEFMEWLIELSVECEEYLNGIIAVDAETGEVPYRFGWYDGEFHLWSREDWEEAS